MPVFLWIVAKTGLPKWAVAAISAVLALLACWGLITFLIHRHDKGVIAAHEADVTNTVNAETNVATAKADAQANVTAAANEERHNQVENAIQNAVAAHPVEAHHSAGPASSAALDRLRRKH
jgi:uncharacterized membrane protein YhiD involved in acid resistance